MTIEVLASEKSWDGPNAVYTPARQTVTRDCGCTNSPISITFKSTDVKEVPVTKTFDTTANKSAALNAINNRVEDLERALFNRAEARIKLETEHNALITEASTKLNRVLAESIHAGIEEEDFELYLPDHEEYLSERLIQVSNEMSLANVLEGV